MGLIPPEKVLFEGQAPDIQRIAAKVVELSGLAVRIRETVDHNTAELYELNGSIAFECAPGEEIHLNVYRAGGYSMSEARFADLDWDNEQERNIAADARYVEPPGKQTLRLWQGLGREPTFHSYVLLAIEVLGGEAEHPLDETSRRLCVGTITEVELERRKWVASGYALLDTLRATFAEPFYLVAEAFGIRFPHRHPHATRRQEEHVLVRMALFPFRLFTTLLGAFFVLLIMPLATLYYTVTFAGKTARLAFHVLTKVEGAEDANLTAAERSARNILNDMKDTYGAPQKVIAAREADFGHLNLRKYAKFQAEMEQLGYRYIGDFEVTERSRTNIASFARTMARVMASPDGSTGASYYQFRWIRWPLVKKLARDLLRLNWVAAPKCFAGMKARHLVEIISVFDDGRWLVVSNVESASRLTVPPAMERHFFPYGTETAVLLDAHRKRMAEMLEASPGIEPLLCSTVEDVVQAHDHMAAAKCAHRASLRWITQDELRALSNGNTAYADQVYAEIQKLLAEEEAAHSSMPRPG